MKRGGFDLINVENDLINSIIEFSSKPEYTRQIIGNNPKYFAFTKVEDKFVFGLSKFCAFKNITPEVYLNQARYATSGGNTREHIARITKRDWKNKNEFPPIVVSQFNEWIATSFPNFETHDFYFIEIKNTEVLKNRIKARLSPNILFKRLEKQREIGEVGELIALEYEKRRLKDLGCIDLNNHLYHISKENVAAGYDIFSCYKKEERYIEVKATSVEMNEFYLTKNEYETLESFTNDAYLYLVHIVDIENKIGNVAEVKNPIPYLLRTGTLEPLLYKVTNKM